MNRFCVLSLCGVVLFSCSQSNAGEKMRAYQNRLTRIRNAEPIFADYPEFVEPIHETVRYAAPVLIDDANADLDVRSWRFSYNARGIIEVPQRLSAADTAVIIVHPWGVDDGQGWNTPEPAGAAFFCTPPKNRISGKHAAKVINPFLKSLRGHVGLVMYSLPGKEDPIRKQLYRSFRGKPSKKDRVNGAKLLTEKLENFDYRGAAVPETISLSVEKPLADYFGRFGGLSAGDRYNNKEFWNQPIPVLKQIDVAPDDVVIYDGDGYDALKTFLKHQGIRHVLLGGYATDMCVCSTTAGYENLRKDFNVFLVGDATLASFPASDTPRHATSTAIANASLDLFITQVSWVSLRE